MTCDRRSRISPRNDSHPSANRAISTGKHLSRQRSHFNTYLSSYLSLSLCLSSYLLARILRFILRLMILDGRRSVKGEGCRHVAHLLLNLSPRNSPLKPSFNGTKIFKASFLLERIQGFNFSNAIDRLFRSKFLFPKLANDSHFSLVRFSPRSPPICRQNPAD